MEEVEDLIIGEDLCPFERSNKFKTWFECRLLG